MMQFNHNAPVYTADGQKAGHIDRVVLDPVSKEVSHVIVRKGLLFTTDKVVPVEMIADATEEQVTLSPGAGNPDDLPDFEEEYTITPDGDELPAAHRGPQRPPMVYWYPYGHGPIHEPDYEQLDQRLYMVRGERNIPQGTIPLKEGATVTGADGKHVGTIERVFVDPATEHVTSFLVSNGLLLKEKLMIPASWVTTFGEEEVWLTVGSRTLQRHSRLIETTSALPQGASS